MDNPFDSPQEVQVAVSGDASGLEGAVANAKGALGGLNKKALAVAGGGIAALSASLATGAVNAAADFEDALIDLEKVAGEEVVKGLEDDIQQMAEEIPLTAEELAGLAEDAARFGVEGEENIAQFTETTAKMSTATQLNTDQAGEAFAKLSKLTNTPIEDVENLGSSVNTLSNNFATDSQEIVDASLKSAGALSDLGLTQTEIFGVSAAVNEVSESSDRAGTRLRRFGQELIDAEPEPFAEALGISTEKFEEMRDEKPAELMGMIAETMNEGGEGAKILRDELSTTSRQAVSGLSQNLEGLENAVGTANDSFEDGESLQREFRLETEKTSTQQELLSSKISNIKRDLGEDLLPAFSDVIDVASDAVDGFTNLNEKTDGMLATFSLGAGIVGGLGTALLALAGGPITAVVGAIAGLALAWQQDWGGIRDVTEQAAEFIQQTTEDFLEFVTQLWDGHGEELTESVEQLTSFIGDVWERFGDDIVEVLQDALDLLVAIVEPALHNILETFDLITDALAGDWEGVWESITSIVQTTIDGIVEIIEEAVDLIGSNVDLVINAILAPFEWLYDKLIGNSLLPRLFDSIPGIIKDAIPSIDGAAGAVKDAVVGVFEDVEEAVTGIAGDMMDGVENALTGAKNTVKGAAGTVGGKITGTFSDIKETVVGTVGDMMDGVADTIDGATDSVVNAAEEQADRARKVYEEDLQEPVTGNSIIPDMMDGIVADIRNATPRIVSATKSIAEKLIDRFNAAAESIGTSAQDIKNDIGIISRAAERVEDDVSTAADGVIQSIDEMDQRISDAQMGPGGFGTPPGRGSGGGGGSGGSGDSGGDGGGDDGGGSGGGGGGGEGTAPPRKDKLQKQAREIQRAFEGPRSLRRLSREEAANQFDGLRLFLNRIGGDSRWFPNVAGLPPQAELTDEDIKKFQKSRFNQLTGEFQVPAEWIRLALDPPFSDPNYAPAGQEVIDNVPQLDTGGAIRRGGQAMLHAGERVLPKAQVSDRGDASFDPDSVADGFDSSSVAGKLVQKLDRIDSAIRDDGTVRVSERDILRTLQRLSDRYDIDI